MKAPLTTKRLPLAEIVTDAGTQIRVAIDEPTVEQYAAAMTDGDTFPNLVVYADGNRYLLADGFHRLFAAQRAGLADFVCEIHHGTKADALKYALSANYAHGLRRTNADKRRSVELALAEWPGLSDRELARICAVSAAFVGEVRGASTVNGLQLAPRLGADGKRRKMPTKRRPSPQSPPPESKPESAPEGPLTRLEVEEVLAELGASPALPVVTQPNWNRPEVHDVGPTKDRLFFSSQVEDVANAILADATPEQLEAAVHEWARWLGKLKKALAEQSKRLAA